MGPVTQEDPIGIAGGLNLYGYANGDPINFSDPFGLCPWCVGALVGVGFEALTQIAERDLNGEALGAAFVIGGLSGGLSVGSRALNVGLQAGLSVGDGAARAALTDREYGVADGVLDASAGIIGEGFGDAVRGLASAPGSSIGKSLEHLNRARSTMHWKAQEAWRNILEGRLDKIEAALAGAASGLAARVGAMINRDEGR
jgi:hypothetical protein